MVLLLGAAMTCCAGCPLDHSSKKYRPSVDTWSGAHSVIDDPWITVLEYGAGVVVIEVPGGYAKPRRRPGGSLASVTLTVRGSSTRTVWWVSPLGPSAVSSSSRCAGQAWSGVVKLPLAAPSHSCRTCASQESPTAQGLRRSSQLRATVVVGRPQGRRRVR